MGGCKGGAAATKRPPSSCLSGCQLVIFRPCGATQASRAHSLFLPVLPPPPAVLASGENVEPQPLEDLLCTSLQIEFAGGQALIQGLKRGGVGWVGGGWGADSLAAADAEG